MEAIQDDSKTLLSDRKRLFSHPERRGALAPQDIPKSLTTTKHTGHLLYPIDSGSFEVYTVCILTSETGLLRQNRTQYISKEDVR